MPLPSRRNERAGLWWALLLALGAGVWLVLEHHRSRGAEKVVREDGALAALRALLDAENAYRIRSGRFGWLPELLAQGALPCATAEGPAGLEGRTEGYRLQVLLPTGRGPTGDVLLGLPGSHADPLLAARYVAVVARPLVPGRDAWRVYYGDETGRIFMQENVADSEGSRENALPQIRLERPTNAETPGPIWRLLSELERRP